MGIITEVDVVFDWPNGEQTPIEDVASDQVITIFDDGSSIGEGEPSQEITQALIDNFSSGDIDLNETLSFIEAQRIFAVLTRPEFDALDENSDGQLSQAELDDVIAPTTSGCNSGNKSQKTFSNLKDFFGDLFLLALLSLVRATWRGLKVRP